MGFFTKSKHFYGDASNVLEDINTVAELQYASMILSESDIDSSISELPLILCNKCFNNIIKYYGGTDLHIPTRDEVYGNMLGLLSYYYYDIKKCSWDETMRILNVSKDKASRKFLNKKYYQVVEKVHDIKIPKFDTKTGVVTNRLECSVAPKKNLVFLDNCTVSKEVYDKIVSSVYNDLKTNKVIEKDSLEKVKSYYENII